jgi:hypothetical protein
MKTILGRLNTISKEQRFFLLLGAILVYLIFEFVTAQTGGGTFIRVTLLSLLLVAAIDCLRFKKSSFLSSRFFGVLVIASGWVDAATSFRWLDMVDGLFRVVFFLIVTGALIYQVAKSARVSLDIIVGAINGYLLLGLVGGVLAGIIDGFFPGAFGFTPQIHVGISKYLYYSYITLATVGYGDITPVVPIAQLLSVVLGVSGQLYIATIIAILIGKYLIGKPAGD